MPSTPDRPGRRAAWARFLELKNRAHRDRREESELTLLRSQLMGASAPFLLNFPHPERLT